MDEEETKFLVKILVAINLTTTALDELHEMLTHFVMQKGSQNDKNPDNFDYGRN